MRDMGMSQIGSTTADNLLGDHPFITKAVTLKSGAAEYPRGTVLGKVTASGLYVPVAPAAEDGSEKAVGVLTETMTVTADADEPAVMYVHGALRTAHLVWPDGTTDAQKTAAMAELQAVGLYGV